MAEGLKREYRISSEDAARPPAQLESETTYFAQGLKPKARVIESVDYEELDEFTVASKNNPAVRLILKTTTYNDGVTVDTTVGEQNEGYQDHLRGVKRTGEGSSSTRRRTPKRKPAARTNKGSKS